ncbi:MAG: DNA replication/repair protein RecF [Pseudomonadota bacterium]
MPLSQIQISRVRNLAHVKLGELAQVNVFFGANGSGKTSVLEAVHLLGMARSFRNTSVKSVISYDEDNCVVFGLTQGSQQAVAPVTLGVQRGLSGDAQIKVGGQTVKSVASLVKHLPVQVINADSFALLTGAPSARRRYLDWGVFHVEQRFLEEWQRFQRGIKQRNKLLRHGKIQQQELLVWTKDLARSGQAIGDYREAYFFQLKQRFKDVMEDLLPALAGGLELRYLRGWDRAMTYDEALLKSMPIDIERGYTHLGPQRADIRVLTGGRLAAETLSRGQQKLVVCGLKLAQGQLVSEQGAARCTYLVDDLPSELDQEHSTQVCRLLASMRAQVFVTCVDRSEVAGVWPENQQGLRMFHVEHGNANEY